MCARVCTDLKEDLGFKDTELLAMNLTEGSSPTRELILSLEQMLSDDMSPLEQRIQVTTPTTN